MTPARRAELAALANTGLAALHKGQAPLDPELAALDALVLWFASSTPAAPEGLREAVEAAFNAGWNAHETGYGGDSDGRARAFGAFTVNPGIFSDDVLSDEEGGALQPQAQPAALSPCISERAVKVCPQCDGEGSYADGLDEAACSTPCARCDGNGWVVDLAALQPQAQPAALSPETER